MRDVETLARDLMSNAGTIREEFTTAKHLEHVRPMFQVNQEQKIEIQTNSFYIFISRKLGHLV